MAYTPIDTLIDKQDNFEIVRDQIAVILALESVSQVARAIAASSCQWKDSILLRVYYSRTRMIVKKRIQ